MAPLRSRRKSEELKVIIMDCRSGAMRLLMRRRWVLAPCVAFGLAQAIAAATLGPPILESGLGEQLRIVMPVTSPGRERLTPDCIKLRSSADEANDISASVRANIVTIGDRQAVVLTTARPVNELVISVAVAIECDTWFTRRYTFLLDLPAGNRTGSQPPAAPAAIEAPPLPSVAAGTPKAASPKQRSSRVAPQAAGVAATPRTVRPEEEPGVLPRQTRSAGKKPVAPMAPPVRSMLKIELGGIDEFLASQPRSLLEEQTGMRLATGLSETDRTKPVASSDPGFRLSHARYLAAMRDAPDPVSLENVTLGKRIDAFSKDLASLKVDLQATRTRAAELEASRVSWWWLLLVALGAGGLAFGAALLLLRRSTAAGPLIVVDQSEEANLFEHPAEHPAPGQHSGAMAAGPTRSGGRGAASAEEVPEIDFSLPELESEASRVADSKAVPVPSGIRPVVTPPPVPDFQATLKLDKRSLTQQLTTMSDLSDEAWASYRHSSDTSGVAVPFGSGPTIEQAGPAIVVAAAAPAPAAYKPARPELATMDFHLDLDEKPAALALAGSAVPATGVPGAPPSEADGDATEAGVQHDTTDEPFFLDTLDLPAGLANPPQTQGPLSVENAAPDAMQSIEMHAVMASASSVMEDVHKLMEQDQPSAALRALGSYLESAPATAPPGPWIMLAHALHQVGMRREYVESQALFKARFGVDLPDWEAAYDLMRQQLGLARMPGIEIMVAAERGKPELIGRLAGVAYRVDVAPEVLFDLAFHREILQQAAACRPGFSTGQGDVDLAL